MMPDFPSATGTLSSWRERRREGGSEAGNRGRGGGEAAGETPKQLVTSFLSQKAGVRKGEGVGSRRRRKERGFSLQGSKIKCQPVCLLRLAGPAGGGSRMGGGKGALATGSDEERRMEGKVVAVMSLHGWMDGSLIPSYSLFSALLLTNSTPNLQQVKPY